MKVNDFVSDIGDMLGENFSTAPIWSSDDIVSYLRKTLKRFVQGTLIVDGDSLRYVDGTTGEASVPSNFLNAYYNQYDKVQLDIVSLGELDFITGAWSSGTTGTSPLVSTVMGSGKDATIRVVPVPTTTSSPFSGITISLVLEDSGGGLWNVGVTTDGVLSTTSTSSGTGQSLVIAGDTTYWDLSINTSGVLVTTASASTTADSLVLVDSNVMPWSVTCSDSGVLVTTITVEYGKLVRIEIDGVNQDFTSDYGVPTDIYAQGVSTTPAAVARLDGPYGTVTIGRVSDKTLHVWYKALLDDVSNTESEIYLNDCFIPIIQHGVLALAFNAEGAGRDVDKSKALEMIFQVECDSVRRIFNRK